MAEKVTIGNCELWHGDCREILPTLPGCDLILTDPPYGIGADARAHQKSGDVQGHGNRRVAARTYEKTEWDNETPPRWLMELMREKGKHQIIFGGNYYDLPPTTCILVWDKKNGTTILRIVSWRGQTCRGQCARLSTCGMALPVKETKSATTTRHKNRCGLLNGLSVKRRTPPRFATPSWAAERPALPAPEWGCTSPA